ncbi:MAG TPA: DEAD/DEAH box helicase family protein [Thermoanaerobaculales bacterium]|nr:DEAD/DEAH box helicase family protein [Thermoanaerobaculales bacterium]
MLVSFPDVLSIDETLDDNQIQQVAKRYFPFQAKVTPLGPDPQRRFLISPQDGEDEVLVVEKPAKVFKVRVLRAEVVPSGEKLDLTAGKWVKHPECAPLQPGTSGSEDELGRVLDSWNGSFSFVEETPTEGQKGLRSPQIGALHAVHAHWSVSDDPATIVMPTGTGKTETMLAILLSKPCAKLLVVVPTDALRTQIARKFLTIGVLKEIDCRVLNPSCLYPIVGILRHKPRSQKAVEELFRRCHVVVTTSSIAGQSADPVQRAMAKHCEYLFIDEAHHIEAPTWAAFKQKFAGRRILQFTATPFREDGKDLGAKIIFKYPLAKAQREGYFQPIRFAEVEEFNPAKADRAIAERAVQQLSAEVARGHVLMARVDSIARAREVFELYEQYPQFHPVQLHTGLGAKKRKDNREAVLRGESRIVVCVDMLGEGFDLPELKIAAFHDIRKTLAVTLQLAGRFTRTRPDLGHATFVANIADVSVRDELRKLYTRDPDWNQLLPELSDEAVESQMSLQEFLNGFTDFPMEVPLRRIRAAASAVVYRTRCASWNPENFKKGIPNLESCARVHSAINEQEHTLVIVTARKLPLAWSDLENLFNWEWELFVVVWLPELDLLFINSSSNAGEYRSLAHAIAGENAELIQGENVFRVFAGVSRLRLQNVGLTEQLGRLVRYTGRMGSDVASKVTNAQRRTTRKAVIAGTGFESGRKTTVGSSRKGRVWSFKRERLAGFVRWCRMIGGKLLDDRIDPDEILRGTLESEVITAIPLVMPIGIDWPEEMYRTPEATWTIRLPEGAALPLWSTSIELVDPTPGGPIIIAVTAEKHRFEMELQLFKRTGIPDYRFIVRDGTDVLLQHGDRGGPVPITGFFGEEPPVVWFADGSSLEGNQYTRLKTTCPPYDANRIQTWDWTGTDLRRESQGTQKDPRSIQFRVISDLKKENYTVIFDDDGSGEAADIVAIADTDPDGGPRILRVDFFHCKYSKVAPGNRIEDLYEVCGQAQKSISWMSSTERHIDLFTHLLRREAKRQDDGKTTRFEHGNRENLLRYREMSRRCQVRFRVFIVQPGLLASNVTLDQLQLLAVTENYLMETYGIPFAIVTSP